MSVIVLAAICAGLGWWLLGVHPGRGRLRRLSVRGTVGRDGTAGQDGEAGRDGTAGPDGGAGRDRGAGAISAPGSTAENHSGLDGLAFDLDLVAICLQAGLPADRALDHAAQASGDRSGLGPVARALRLGTAAVRGLRPELEAVVTLIRFSGRTGVALAPLLSAHASELRASENRRRQIAAARLGVMLVLPLGVCVLPAFILLGVVPVLLTLVGDIAPAFSG